MSRPVFVGLIHINLRVAQQQRHEVPVPFLDSPRERRPPAFVGLIHINLRVAQQQRHDVRVPFLGSPRERPRPVTLPCTRENRTR